MLVVLCLGIMSLYGYSQETITMSFEETYETDISSYMPSAIAKELRTSSKNGGHIEVEYLDNNLPDSLKMAVKVATGIWEDYLGIGDSLTIEIKYIESVNGDIATNVHYTKDLTSGLYYPLSLWCKLNPQVFRKPIAELLINSNSDWCVGIGSVVSENKKNLFRAILQNIAKCLGYGSSVITNPRGDIKFTASGPSVFDNMIFSEGGQRMANLTNSMRQEFKQFAQQSNGYLYVAEKTPSYKLYAPQTFDKYKSLKYSCDSTSIMYYGEQYAKDLVIDATTLNILFRLGWKLKNENQLEIICDSIDSTGVTSAYKSYNFHVAYTGFQFENPEWKFMLPLKIGGYETVLVSSDSEFVIPALTDAAKYEHTIEGDIRGLITCKGVLDGIEVSANYNITFELRPSILRLNVVNVTPCEYDETFYDAEVEVFYEGAYYCHAYVEEEYSPSTETYFSNSPFYTRFMMRDIDSWGNAMINVIVRNAYGSDTKTIEIPAAEILNIEKCSVKKTVLKRPSFMDVYDVGNTRLGRVSNFGELSKFQEKHLILKCYKDGMFEKVIKYMCK